MKPSLLFKAALAILVLGATVWAQEGGPASPTDVVAEDHPWDGGTRLDVSWTLSADDALDVSTYKIYRTLSEAEMLKEQADARSGAIDHAKQTVTAALFTDADQQGISHNDPELLARIRAARQSAADEALAAVNADISAVAGETKYKFISILPAGSNVFTVEKLNRAEAYGIKVVAIGKNGVESTAGVTTAAVQPVRQGFDGARFFLFAIVIIICGAVIYYIRVARSGRPLNIRKIAGLEAVYEAVGRATEMGRSILFVPGIQDINDIQTIAGMTILSRVAKTAASYEAKLEVPTSRALVMTTARETVQAAFLAAGRPDAFDPDLIYYVTDEQFGYVAYLSGMMVREKPAACFYMGSFFAESLILAETGNAIGAIQIAGTAQPAQLPFFVAACDYTLIGEEFFAASAILSGESDQLGSLKGQDVGKSIAGIIMVIGVTMLALAAIVGSGSGFGAAMLDTVDFLKSIILT